MKPKNKPEAQPPHSANQPFSSEIMQKQADSLPFIIWTADANGQIDYSNHHFFAYTGISPKSDPANRWQQTLHPDDLPRCSSAWEIAVREQTFFDIEYRIRRQEDHAYRWFRVQAAPIRDGQNCVLHWYGTALDIHDSKVLEEKSAMLTHRLNNTLESITDAFFTIDRDWIFTYLNHQAEINLQRDRRELIGQSIWKEFPEAIGTTFEKMYRLAIKKNRTVSFQEYFEPLRAWYDVRAYPSPDGLAIYFRDITEQYKIDEKLQEQAALLDKARDAILVRDLHHHILYWNKSAEKLYGWSAEEVQGKSIKEILYQDPAAFLKATRIVVQEGEWIGEIQQYNRQGKILSVEGRWTLLRDKSGKPKSILAINTDITERKKLEQQFLRAQRMESIGTLAGGIAHDLNNLLSPIVMGVDLLRSNNKDPRMAKVIENIGESAQRGTDLVKQVLSFARGVEGARIPIHVANLLQEIENITSNTFPKNITFRKSLDDNLWSFLGDPTQLNQILLNLCVNARDAMPDGGLLEITARNVTIDKQYAVMDRGAAAGNYVSLQVTDNGCGMTPDVRDRVFEPFFTTKEVGKGTGLGLSTVVGIIRSHGGFINVYSEPNRGSSFKAYLPAYIESGNEEKPDNNQEAFPRGKGECILVVDDEISILTMTKQTLETFGYKVITAEDGAQAIALYAEHRNEVKVVLTDMMMPVMDGPSLIYALKRFDAKMPIIAASGLNANGSVAKASDAGVKNFLAKPYSADRLLKMVREVLS